MAPEAAGRNFPFSSLFTQLLAFSFGFSPPLSVVHLRASVLSLNRTGLKWHLIRGLWLTHAWGREGYGMGGEPEAAEASVRLQQAEVCHVSSWGSCPWIRGPW